ncbi:serine/threonine protein kinase, negative regulator of sexual conjugation and meiosis [Hygrophoropsis aurantiaca]|uniref:Serine/threonine protein kinase, negative regulator of sexual conjugation and meiosis n=1 Tax=Hygrophoropsis aurantiaca TaxID=72124 RepID=A0ACB8ALG8_9AGAM|nr:serine/threonine protein kinase, negative regulator of sexual conjugation and meiosis [Hygrophoropsis aurantiaca]
MVCPSSTLPDFSGQVIDNGRYLLINALGSGAYGVVYRALDTTSNPAHPMHYAVKCMSKSKLTPAQLASQDREILLHSIVSRSSPHVLTLHGVVEEELYLYLILDLCAGDMFSAIKRSPIYHGNMPLMKQVFVELLDAVQACHDRGVFHRDLKPENILCGKGGAGILLADFGLATKQRVCTEFGCGSIEYMSPECLGREIKYPNYSPRHTDIWSLGVILINLVFARSPWRIATASDSGFLSYLYNSNYLCDVLPISRELNEVVKRIFNLSPLERISIPELREEILKMDNFYMSHDEMAWAADHAGPYALPPRRPPTPMTKLVVHHVSTGNTLINDPSDQWSSSSSSSSSLSSETHRSPDSMERIRELVGPSWSPPPPSWSDDPSIRLVVQSGPRRENFIIGSDSGDGSSDAESEGPITPETFAFNVANDVPALNLSEEENILDRDVYAKDVVANAPTKSRRLPAFFRSAAQHLRAS